MGTKIWRRIVGCSDYDIWYCSVGWRPKSVVLVNKVESIQRRAVKWILGKQDHHYNNDIEAKRARPDANEAEIWIYRPIIISSDIKWSISTEAPILFKPSDQGRLRTNTRQPSRPNEFDTSRIPDINPGRKNRLVTLRYPSLSIYSMFVFMTWTPHLRPRLYFPEVKAGPHAKYKCTREKTSFLNLFTEELNR